MTILEFPGGCLACKWDGEDGTGDRVCESERLRFRFAEMLVRVWCRRVGSRSDWVGGARLEMETSAEKWA